MIASEKITNENKDGIKLKIKKKITSLESRVMEHIYITVKVDCNGHHFDLPVDLSIATIGKLAKTIVEVFHARIFCLT